jgi:subtilisin-like proprotein convertase family protein
MTVHWRVALCALTLAILSVGNAWAEIHSIPLDGTESRLDVIHESRDAVRFRVEVGELRALDVETREGSFTRLLIPGFHSSQTPGEPALPMMNRLIAIPTGARARVDVLSSRSRVIDLADHGIAHPLMPAQPSMPKSADPATWPFVYERAAYDVDRVAREAAVVVDVGTLRAMNLGRLEISPVEYLPRTNQIRVLESLEVEVSFPDADFAAQRDLIERTYSPFFEHLYGRAANYRAFHDAYPDRVRNVVTLVVVTPPAYEATLADYIAWKEKRGFHVIVGVLGSPEVGSTTSSIQTWLHGLYTSPPEGLPAPSFVVFVGDVAEMPTFSLSGDATDRPYCAVDADLMPDMYYGRLSATSPTQLANILEKTLMFDQYTMPDPSYLGEVVMIAGMDAGHGSTWGNGQINYGTTYYFNLAHGIESHTYLYPESGSNAANIVQNVSDGVSYINYTAHGSTTSWSDPSFTQSNVNGLANYGKYCLAVGNCCLTSTYDIGECFAETWLRAEDKGAIGYIGGSNSTYWDEDYWWGVGYTASIVANPTYEGTGIGAYDGLFHDHGEAEHLWYVTNDALIFSGNLAVTEAGSSRITYYWNIYNLMGDPSLSTYLGVPTANPVSHLDTVFTTSPSMTIQADHGSYVGLTQAGTLVGAGTVGSSGSLEIDFLSTPLTPGVPLHVVVMAQNRVPYEADIDVIVPATVSIVPGTIDANVPTAITVTVLEADGITPQVGIDVWAEGLGYSTTPVATNSSGVAVVNVDYPYGPTLDIVGQDPAVTYRLFTEPVAVNAGTLFLPDLTVVTSIGLTDTLALNLPAQLQRSVAEPGAVLWAFLPDGSSVSTTDKTLDLTVTTLGDVDAIIAVSGYDLYSETFPVIEAYGTLTGTVSSGGGPIAGAVVKGYDAGMALAFEAVTNASGFYDVGEDVLVADYTLMVDEFGYLHSETPFFLNYGPNVQDIELTSAPSGILSGTVTEVGTGLPLAASVKVYRSDNLELWTETVCDSTDGSYATADLPYFDYEVRVRAWHHVPETRVVTVSSPAQTEDFVLDTTAGDLLVLDDGAAARTVPAKVSDKDGSVLAEAYAAAPSKSAAELAVALEDLGYFVTAQTIGASDPATWGDYDLLIVASGDNTTTLSSGTVRAALVDHVEAGGHLLIEGGEVGYDHYSSDPAFAATVLHSTDWNHDSSGNLTVADPTHYVMSVPNAIAGPVTLNYGGYGDADAMVPLSDAVMVGSWTSYPTDASVITFDPNPAPEGGQIVYFAFNWTALAAGPREELLENAVLWLMTPEAGSCSVSGVVTLSGETDHSGVLVRAVPGTASTLTDASGAYTLPGLFPGSCAIVATKENWSVGYTDVTLLDGQDMTGVDFVLSPVLTELTCETPGLAIPDDNPVGVSDVMTMAAGGEVSGLGVYVDITHTYIGDLLVTLTSPSATTVTLHNRTGGTAENIVGWYPDDLTPAGSLDAFLGEPMGGDWILTVSDHAGADVGVLNEWCLRILHPAGPVDAPAGLVPPPLALAQNYPNPFGLRTTFRFSLPREMDVDLSVYNVAGQRVATLVHEVLPVGHHRIEWSGRDQRGTRVANGVYFYRLSTEDAVLTRKLLRLK